MLHGFSEDNPLLGVVGESPEELNAHCPPPSLVPRLHAVLCHHLHHTNPLTPHTGGDDYTSGDCYMDVRSYCLTVYVFFTISVDH